MLGFQRFQVFIGLALNGSCVILKIGKRYDHDDGGAFNALQEEKGRPEGLLKHGRHVAWPGHTRRLQPILRGGGVDAEGTEEYLEAQVRHRRSA